MRREREVVRTAEAGGVTMMVVAVRPALLFCCAFAPVQALCWPGRYCRRHIYTFGESNFPAPAAQAIFEEFGFTVGPTLLQQLKLL